MTTPDDVPVPVASSTVRVRVYYAVANSVIVTLEGPGMAEKSEDELIALAGAQIKVEDDEGPDEDYEGPDEDYEGPDYDYAMERLAEDGVLTLQLEDSYVTDEDDC